MNKQQKEQILKEIKEKSNLDFVYRKDLNIKEKREIFKIILSDMF